MQLVLAGLRRPVHWTVRSAPHGHKSQIRGWFMPRSHHNSVGHSVPAKGASYVGAGKSLHHLESLAAIRAYAIAVARLGWIDGRELWRRYRRGIKRYGLGYGLGDNDILFGEGFTLVLSHGTGYSDTLFCECLAAILGERRSNRPARGECCTGGHVLPAVGTVYLFAIESRWLMDCHPTLGTDTKSGRCRESPDVIRIRGRIAQYQEVNTEPECGAYHHSNSELDIGAHDATAHGVQC